jgi:endonuclease/exonuclease/phosphatase (EEP) superfamily protein YafD
MSFLLAPPLFLLAALCAGAALAAQQGRTSLRWDLLTHFAPIWFAGALIAALFAWLAFWGLARWVIVALGLVGMVAAGLLMWPELTRSTGPHAGPDAPGQLKIIQFNVWNRDTDPVRTVDWMVAQHPDIVILEETTPEFRRLVETRTGWTAPCRNCEVMIYSRLPGRVAPLPPMDGPPPGPMAHATFQDALGPFTVIGVHDAWPTDGGDAPAPQGRLAQAIGAHAPWPYDAKDQQRQEARLAEVIAALPRERIIVTGDFNSTPWSFSRRRWDQAFGIPRRDRAIFSWPAGRMAKGRLQIPFPFPFLPIDHVYAGPGWATVSIRRGPKLGSDHYPLVAILAPVARPSADLPAAGARRPGRPPAP